MSIRGTPKSIVRLQRPQYTHKQVSPPPASRRIAASAEQAQDRLVECSHRSLAGVNTAVGPSPASGAVPGAKRRRRGGGRHAAPGQLAAWLHSAAPQRLRQHTHSHAGVHRCAPCSRASAAEVPLAAAFLPGAGHWQAPCRLASTPSSLWEASRCAGERLSNPEQAPLPARLTRATAHPPSSGTRSLTIAEASFAPNVGSSSSWRSGVAQQRRAARLRASGPPAA